MIYSTEHLRPEDEERIFPLFHNFDSPVRERLDYLTDIITSGNGKEQRRAVRYEPRHQLRLSCIYSTPEAHRKLDGFMASWFPKQCLLEDPVRFMRTAQQEGTHTVYSEGIRSSSTLIDGQSEVTFIGGERPWMSKSSGNEVVLINGPSRLTIGVRSYDEGKVTFTSPVTGDWPSGTKIVPSNFEVSVDVTGLAWMNITDGSNVYLMYGQRWEQRTVVRYAGDTIEFEDVDSDDWPAGTKIASHPTKMPILGEIPEWLTEIPSSDFPVDVIFSTGKIKETRQISEVGPDYIVYLETSVEHFPAGSKMHPCLKVFLNTDLRSSRLTSNKGTIDIEASVIPGTERIVPDGTGAEFIGNRRLFNISPNWQSAPEVTADRPREMVDFNYGVVQPYYPIKFPSQTKKLNFLKGSFADGKYAKDFFVWHLGRNREFFLPTFENDIPYYAVAGGSMSLLVRGRSFAVNYKDSTVYRRLVIHTRDGHTVNAQIDFIEDLAETDSSVIWVTQPLPSGINLAPSNVLRCSWVFVARFASDTFELEWRTNEVATFAMTIKSLENPDL